MKSNTGNNINNTNTCSCHGQRNRLIKELLCLFSDLFLFISVLLVLVVYGQKMRSVFFSVVILHYICAGPLFYFLFEIVLEPQFVVLACTTTVLYVKTVPTKVCVKIISTFYLR